MNKKSYKELFLQKFKEIEHICTFKDFFEWIKNNDQNHILFEYGNFSCSCKYFSQKVNSVCLFLKEKLKDVKKGSWIGMKLPNHPYYIITLFALLKNHFNVLFIDNNISESNYNKVVKQSGISAVVTDKIIAKENIFYISFNEIINVKNYYEAENLNFFADKLALCSSGTEGNVKISVYDDKNFLELIKKTIRGFSYTFPKNMFTQNLNKVVIAPPFFHLFGIGSIFVYILLNITIVINESNALSCFLKNAKKDGVQIVLHVPMILDALLQFIKGKYNNLTIDNFKKIFGKNVKIFIGAGIGATGKVKKILKEYGIYYIDCYGTTESGIVSINGMLCKAPSFKIEVYKNGNFFNQGYGELIVYGKGIRIGILENGIEIDKLNILKENCIKTGDLVEIKRNKIYVKGRTNDIIISSNGENIVPNQIEEYFYFLKNYDCKYTVFGINDIPIMVVFMKKMYWNISYKEVLIKKISQKNGELKLNERISTLYFTLMPIPFTGSFKIKKNVIKEQIKNNQQKFEKVILIRRKIHDT